MEPDPRLPLRYAGGAITDYVARWTCAGVLVVGAYTVPAATHDLAAFDAPVAAIERPLTPAGGTAIVQSDQGPA